MFQCTIHHVPDAWSRPHIPLPSGTRAGASERKSQRGEHSEFRPAHGAHPGSSWTHRNRCPRSPASPRSCWQGKKQPHRPAREAGAHACLRFHHSKQGLPFTTPPAVNSSVGTLQGSLSERGDANPPGNLGVFKLREWKLQKNRGTNLKFHFQSGWWPTTLGGSFGFKTPRFPGGDAKWLALGGAKTGSITVLKINGAPPLSRRQSPDDLGR
jgi:hypothetical protein